MRNLLLIGMILFSGCLFAQNFSVFDEEGHDVSGTTINLSGNLDTEIAFEFQVKNLLSSDVDAKLELIPVSIIDGSGNTFCVPGQCVMPGQLVSPEFSLVSNELTEGFSFHYNAYGNEGESTFRIKIFNSRIETDTVDFTLVINASNSAVENIFGQMLFSDVYPNPASAVASIDYNLRAGSDLTVTVYDMLGKKIREYDVSGHGVIQLPVGDLQAGTYFCRYIMDGDLLETQKLLIK